MQNFVAVVVVFLIGFLFSDVVSGARPELLSSSIWYTNSTVLNVDYEVAVVQMEFDQPLYTTGQTYLCSSVDLSCPPLECTPCDWSGQQPTGCEDPSCCQSGNTEQAKSWCDPNPYETLKIEETSKKYTLEKGERMDFRFFIPEEYYCHPAIVVVRPSYGTATMFLSTLDPNPDFTTLSGWVQGAHFPVYGFGLSSISICPVINLEYNVGTYALGVYATVPTSFVVEVHVSQQKYPLPPPPVRISCDDIPEEEYEYAAIQGSPVVCLEDGVSKEMISNFSESNPYFVTQILSAVPQGCHTYSFSVSGSDPFSFSDIFCLPVQGEVNAEYQNALLATVNQPQTSLVWSGCYEEEVTYVLCGIVGLRTPGFGPSTRRIAFSTQSEVLRQKITDAPHASLSYQDGMQAVSAVTFGNPKFACFDFFVSCFDWVVPPSTDPLFLFPPASSFLHIYDTNEDLEQTYLDSGLSTMKENTLVAVIGFEIGGQFNWISRDLSKVSIAVPKITNEFGEVVHLPGGGYDPALVPAKNRISPFIPHIPILSIPNYVPPKCDMDKYIVYQELVQDKLLQVPDQSTLAETQFIKYSLDIMAAATLATTCTNEVSTNINSVDTSVVLHNQTSCVLPFGTPEWFHDPCCNPFFGLFCCLPFSYNTTVDLYTKDTDVSGCAVPDCAESYYEELSFSLNYVNDPNLGCTTGIVDYGNSLALFLDDIIQEHFIECLDEVGFGAKFLGIPCQENSDCLHLQGTCYQNVCVVAPLKEFEDHFLTCYIQRMSSSAESYIKENVLPPSAVNYSKTSPQFFQALKEAATVRDCVNLDNPLEISHRNRYSYSAENFACITLALNYSYPDELDLALAACPPGNCLGTFCQMDNTGCHQLCHYQTLEFVEATDELCPDESECITGDSGDCSSGAFCMDCPPNGDLPCLKVLGIGDQGTCESSIACELPDGSVEYGLTESECREKDAQCTTDCVGESCASVTNMDGICYVSGGGVSSLDSCNLYGSDNSVEVEWYEGTLCVLVSISSSESCSQYDPTVWETCQQNSVGECTGEPFPQRYLGCYISIWHDCVDEDECVQSGSCSDQKFTVIVKSDVYPVVVQHGACMGAGVWCGRGNFPCCGTDEYTGIGCRTVSVNESAQCFAARPQDSRQWLAPASTEEECLGQVAGRYGCQIWSLDLDNLLWIFEEEECTCSGGSLQNRWIWTPGVWQGGVPRSLQWQPAEVISPYVMEDSLSFLLLSDWITQSAEQRFLYSLKSEILCESESISVPVFTLVCDCLSTGGEHCYTPGEEEKEILMGFSEICEGESSFVKDPSAQISFNENSVQQCSFLNISIIYRNWFVAPFTPPPVSFEWQKTKQSGIVINQKGATVGEVLGDGVVLSFANPELIGMFEVCLRVSLVPDLNDGVAPDFGFATSDLVFIYPVGLEETQLDIQDRNSIIWWCAQVDYQSVPSETGIIRLFPIVRIKDYESEEVDYASHKTTSLMYTLGACYCFIGFWCVLGLIAIFVDKSSTTLSFPKVCTFLFLILCVFRAVFMFLYPIGRLDDEPVAYFVIFEIPTFLLFSILVFSIYTFKRVAYRKAFFPQEQAKFILILGLPLVWSLWLIVTLVYSEVIVGDSSGESACEGRVAVSYSEEEEDTRKLAIVYQSIIIAVTIVLGTIFFYFSFKMFQSAKRMGKTKQFVVVVGGIFTIAFLIRTILFLIILAADFESSVYMFITLFITEILMMVLLLIQFQKRFFLKLMGIETGSSSSGTSSTKTSHTAVDN